MTGNKKNKSGAPPSPGQLGLGRPVPSTAASIAVLQAVAIVLAVWMCGGLPLALLCVHVPLSILAGTCALVAAARLDRSEAVLRAGRRALQLLYLSALAAFVFSSGDWVHSLWSVQYPLSGLLFGSGLLLVGAWPGDRRSKADPLDRWNGATVALLATALLGALPLALAVLPFNVRPLASEGGPLIGTFFEVARYGFGGPVPALMESVNSHEASRGLGVPPRIVTVTMGASLVAALHWILFATLALAGRAIPAGLRRKRFFLLAPMVLGLAAISPVVIGAGGNMDRTLYKGIWRNEPWLVQAYGPTLLVALLLAAVLLYAVRRDRRLALQAR